jgi:hypothetical protein
MSFLAPWALWLGALAAIPLALHLWHRRTAARRDFPAVRYLQRMAQDHAREVRVQNVLLLLLRLGIVVAIALAAARPFAAVPAVGGAVGHPPVAMALVLDNSLSTQAVTEAGPMLDRLRELAGALLDAAGPEDRLWLVTMDGVVRGGAAPVLRAALAERAALEGAGDAGQALARATAVVRESTLPLRQVVVLTDGQRSTWDPVVRAATARGSVAWRVAVPTLAWRPNHGVREAVPVPPVWGAQGAVRFRVGGADSVAWRVEVAGRPFARGTAGPAGAGLARGRPTQPGWGAGVIELTPDELRGDDRRYFAVRVGTPPAVEVDPSSGPFVARAVEALVDAGHVRRGPGTLIGTTARPGVTAVVLAPADPVRLPEVNRALERAAIPWRFGAPRQGELRVALGDSAEPTVRRWYPLTAAPMTADARVDTLARVGAAPWVVRGDGYLLIASPLDPAATDLPLSARFVPWLGTLLTQRLEAGEVGVLERAPGALVAVPRGVDALEASDGTLQPVVAGGTIDAPWRAGVAFWRRGASRVGALVVNPEPTESDAAREDASALARRLDATPLPAEAGTIATAVFASGGPRPLDRSLLLLALLLLLVEALVARRGRRARAASLPV